MSVWLADEAATLGAGGALGESLAAMVASGELDPRNAANDLASGLHLHLRGELGAGKTTLVRGFLRALGVRGAVKSPTYTLVEPYEVSFNGDEQPCSSDSQTPLWDVFHFDLYRLAQTRELELLGIRDYFHSSAVCLFEWPQRAAQVLPLPSLELSIEAENQGRRLHLEAINQLGEGLNQGFLKRIHC